MRKLYLPAIISVLMVGCGGGGADTPNIVTPPTQTENQQPTPNQPTPQNPPEVDTGLGQQDGDSYFKAGGTEPLTLEAPMFDRVWTRSTEGLSIASYFRNPFDIKVSFAGGQLRSSAAGDNQPKYVTND